MILSEQYGESKDQKRPQIGILLIVSVYLNPRFEDEDRKSALRKLLSCLCYTKNDNFKNKKVVNANTSHRKVIYVEQKYAALEMACKMKG